MEVIELFNRLARETSPQVKVKMLQSYPYQESLKAVLKAALDPFITYGITDFGVPESFRGIKPSDVLEMLATRKATGNFAKQMLADSLFNSDDGEREVFRRILRKDLRCGVGVKLVEQAFPGLLRVFSVMRAEKYGKMLRGASYFIEPKLDGLRGLSLIRGDSVTILSRNGLEFSSVDHLKGPILKALENHPDRESGLLLDGELKSGNFNESSSHVRGSTPSPEVKYHIFDIFSMEEWKSPSRHYVHRRMDLEKWVGPSPKDGKLVMVPSYRVESEEELYRYYAYFRDRGDEGGILKRGDGLYRGRKHRDWMKLKATESVDLQITGIIEGTGKYRGMMGAAISKFNGKKVQIGSGWSDAERDEYYRDPNKIIGTIWEIEFHEVTPDGSLRHPRAARKREDKADPDIRS